MKGLTIAIGVSLVSSFCITVLCHLCGMPGWTSVWLSAATGVAIGFTVEQVYHRRRR